MTELDDTRPPSPGGEVVVYEAPDGEVSLSVRLEEETVWLTERQMADAFETTGQNVNRHLQAIFLDGELDRGATSKDFLLVRSEGRRKVRRVLTHYNLKIPNACRGLGVRCMIRGRC